MNGHPNDEGQKFCGQCGVPLGQSEFGTTRPAPTAAEPPSGADAGATPPRTAPRGEDRIDSALKGGLNSLKSVWAKLPKWGKVAAAGVPVLAVVALIAGGGRDRESYEFGYQRGQAGLTQEFARGSSPEKACRSNVEFFKVMVRGKKIDVDDAVEGCLDALKGRPLAPGG